MKAIVIPCSGDKALIPQYGTQGASGADLRACIAEDIVIAPGQRMLIPTGLRLEIPSGYEGQVRSRSGLAIEHGIVALNSPGTIDSDYRGEIKVILINHGDKEFVVKPGYRIAQLVICPVVRAVFSKTEQLSESKRGIGGFGSTEV